MSRAQASVSGLPPSDRSALQQLFNEARFFDLPPELPTPARREDRFEYAVTIHEGPFERAAEYAQLFRALGDSFVLLRPHDLLPAAVFAPNAAGSAINLVADLFVLAFQLVAAAGLGLVALGGLALLVNVFLLYTEGRPVELALPPSDAAAAAAAN